MPKTEADKWFEAYLLEHGYTPGSHEPDLSELGVRSRPDYLPMRPSGERIACEVKSFGINRLTERLGRQRTIVASSQEEYGPVRGQVKAAARTLKPLHPHGFPLVVVLTKTDPAVLVDLTVDAVAAALYGNPGYVLEIDRRTGAAVDEGRYELGRDGKLTTDHPYLGAVALLRRRPHEADERAELHEEVRRTAPDYDALSNRERATLHLQALEGRVSLRAATSGSTSSRPGARPQRRCPTTGSMGPAIVAGAGSPASTASTSCASAAPATTRPNYFIYGTGPFDWEPEVRVASLQRATR